ncbi:MAG TPA: prolipoprotein diacylglyceryl transferase family protein [Kofleriaceae bacterium]|nr:prolipoprotein diacylglyceryl transferase family protein [Kofleriaceae bacterium]
MLFIVLALRAAISLWLAVAIIAANLAGFFAWTALSRTWRGKARYVLLEHAFVAGGATVMLAMAADVRLAEVLDPWVVALALALGFGRIGCLMSGCCHGKLATRGVRYRWRLPWLLGPRWRDVRLYPLQAIEAASLFVIAAAGLALLSRQGESMVVVPAAYAVLRFELEIWRGDERRYIGPLSHNQWSCLALISLVAVADVRVAEIAAAAVTALSVAQRRCLVPPAIAVTSKAQMAALMAAIAAAREGQPACAAGICLEPDQGGGVSARGAWRPLQPSELRVIAIAVDAARARSAS